MSCQPPWPSPPPNNENLNLGEVQGGKRQRAATAAAEERVEFAIGEDDESWVNEKTKGKSRNDRQRPSRSTRRKKAKRQFWQEARNQVRKMKSDQLMENIKNLRACVWLLEKEGAEMAEIKKFKGLLESAEKEHAENANEELKKQYASLEERLRKEEAEKMDAIQSCGEEKRARVAAESSQNMLSEDLNGQWPSRSARRKKANRQFRQEARNQVREMKSDQLMENIRKLRACVWLLEKEGAKMAEIKKFKGLLESAEKEHAENANEELKKQYVSLEERLRKEEAEKMDAIQSCGEEKGARVAAESSRNMLSEDLNGQRPSRSARRKKAKRQFRQEARNQVREMKSDRLMENIKKLRACVWLLEKEGAEMAEIKKFKCLLEAAEKQHAENANEEFKKQYASLEERPRRKRRKWMPSSLVGRKRGEGCYRIFMEYALGRS